MTFVCSIVSQIKRQSLFFVYVTALFSSTGIGNYFVIPRWGKLYKENPQTPRGVLFFLCLSSLMQEA